jgi:hypothetical protein
LSNLAASPFTVIPVHAADRASTLAAMRLLYTAASVQDRKVLWCKPSEQATDELARAEVADTVVSASVAHQRLTDGTWRLPTGSIVVIDDAAAAQPETIADIAAARRTRRPA